MSSEHIELSQYLHDDSVITARPMDEDNFLPNAIQPTVPLADTGKEAWLLLLACFMVEALIWGFAFTFGLFQLSYAKAFPEAENVTLIGTCCMGIIYLTAPVIFPTLAAWPQLRRPAALVGLLLMCLALALGSLAHSVNELILTHGILYALGAGLCYSPTISFVNEWFIRRRGLAFGIMWAGTGVSGVILPLLMQWLLDSYGFRTALRVWSVTLFILTLPLIHFLRPRLPYTHTSRSHSRRPNLSFLASPEFLIIQACNIIEGLGYFLPTIYLPTFATSVLGSSQLASATTVILVNVAQIFGCIAMGSLCDKFHVTTCILISTLGTLVGVFLFWGFATTLPLLYVFCLTYGLFAGSYSSSWAGSIKMVQEKMENVDGTVIFSMLAFGRGIGNVVSGPLSEALVRGHLMQGTAKAYGSDFGALILFTGLSAAIGGCSFLARGWRSGGRIQT